MTTLISGAAAAVIRAQATPAGADILGTMLPGSLRALLDDPMRRIQLRSRVTSPYWRRRFHSFGEDTILDRPDWVLGAHQIAIGAHSLVLRGAHLSVETHAWGRPAPVLQIGDRVGIRPHCTFSVSEQVVIEDDVIIGAFSSVIDSDHTFELGRPNVMHNPVASSPIRIGRGTWLAERVAVLRGANIGRCCIVGANSVVKGDLPDYSIAVGSPARVVGRVEGVDADAPPFREGLW
jgi:acetyltransferase-like isoleucine patch superfamily enzyme